MNWLEIIRTLWPIAATLTPIIIGAGFIWLRLQFVGKADFDKLGECVQEHTTKIAVLEEGAAAAPTRQDLGDDIGELGERIARLEAGQLGIQRELSTANRSLELLVDKAVRQAA